MKEKEEKKGDQEKEERQGEKEREGGLITENNVFKHFIKGVIIRRKSSYQLSKHTISLHIGIDK